MQQDDEDFNALEGSQSNWPKQQEQIGKMLEQLLTSCRSSTVRASPTHYLSRTLTPPPLYSMPQGFYMTNSHQQ